MKRYYPDNRNNLVAVLAIFALVAVALLFVNWTIGPSGITGLATSASQRGNFSATISTYVACTWSNAALDVSFGTSLDPSSTDINGTGNYEFTSGPTTNGTMYNLTVDTLTNVPVNVQMLGSDLTSGSNTITVGNITWSSSSTSA